MSLEINFLTTRLASLNAAVKQTLQLIQQLARVQSSTAEPSSSNDPMLDEAARTDITASIHEQLKQTEEELEILRQDVFDVDKTQMHASGRSSRRSTALGRENEAQKEIARCLAGCEKLVEDLKLTRTRFRRAQLTAKSNAERAVFRERASYLASLQAAAASTAVSNHSDAGDKTSEESKPPPRFTDLFAGRRPRPSSQNPGATQDDILLTTSSDVTSSLRRTHNLLQSEISRSQFAHETLATSNAALEELNARYNTFDDLLSKSRGLLGTLLRSQKSDTWYLETTIAVLLGTIGWLVFRRFLYGPAWWLVWMPLKLIFNLLGGVGWILGVTGGQKGAETTAIGRTTIVDSATVSPSVLAGSATVVYAETRAMEEPAYTRSPPGSLSESVGHMIETSGSAEPLSTGSGEASDEQQRRDRDDSSGQQNVDPVRRGDDKVLPERDEKTQPRNPKKRMLEEPAIDQNNENEKETKKNEL